MELGHNNDTVMFSTVIILFVFLNYTVALKDLSLISPVENTKSASESILCRNCGNNVSSSNNIISKPSSAAQELVYDILYGKQNVLIQILASDVFFRFPVVTTDYSSCVGVGEWEESEYWYPGYRRRPCSCPECGAYVGWVFEPINLNWANPHSFFGLILTNIVGESCK